MRQLFGRPEKEAQLALSLANGRTLRRVADEFGTRLNTACAHLRAIYAKTGIDRQAKLRRANLRSVVALS